MPAPLHYLVFDSSDTDDGIVTLQAMATTAPTAHAAVMAEVDAVLDWAAREFPGGPGPLEDGHGWDRDLQVDDEDGWVAVTLTLAGPERFAQAFADAFVGIGDDG